MLKQVLYQVINARIEHKSRYQRRVEGTSVQRRRPLSLGTVHIPNNRTNPITFTLDHLWAIRDEVQMRLTVRDLYFIRHPDGEVIDTYEALFADYLEPIEPEKEDALQPSNMVGIPADVILADEAAHFDADDDPVVNEEDLDEDEVIPLDVTEEEIQQMTAEELEEKIEAAVEMVEKKDSDKPALEAGKTVDGEDYVEKTEEAPVEYFLGILDGSVKALEEELEGISEVDYLLALEEAEKAGKNRKGALSSIAERLETVKE